MNIAFHKLTPRHLLNLAPLLSIISAALTYSGTESFWLALAVAFICLTLHTLAMAIVWQIELLYQHAEDAALDHHKVAMPEPRHQSRYCTATAAGYALPQILGFIVCLLGTLLFVPACYVILITVMGAQEPRW